MITTRNRCYFSFGTCNNNYFSKETSNNLFYIKDFDVISTLDMAAKSFLIFIKKIVRFTLLPWLPDIAKIFYL